jgi:hypothetical protein
MITLPGPMPYDSEKAIPWHYGADVYYHGVKQDSGSSENSFVEDNDVDVNKFSGEGRLMRSGRVLSPPNLHSKADALAKAKGKQVMVDGQGSEQTNAPKPLVAPDVS